MAQQYGLGRGLSSLIPQKQPKDSTSQQQDSSSSRSQPAQKPQQHLDGEETLWKGESSATRKIETDQEENKNGTRKVSVEKIQVNSHQPRTQFNEEKLRELSKSIQQHGVIQPLVVMERQGGTFELIAGERRLRAAKMAGLETVPVVVYPASFGKQQKLELAIIENVQRHDLNPMEEARAYERLSEEFDLSQEEVAQKMGKSRSAIANTMRLLHLPVEMQRAVEEEKMSEGHAKAILALDNPEKQRALFNMIVKKKLTVRQAEAQSRQVTVGTHTRNISSQDPQLKAIEDELEEKLGTKVQVKKYGQGVKIRVDFYSRKEVVDFMNRMK